MKFAQAYSIIHNLAAFENMLSSLEVADNRARIENAGFDNFKEGRAVPLLQRESEVPQIATPVLRRHQVGRNDPCPWKR